MTKNYFLLALALICFAGRSNAQVAPCSTDEVHNRLLLAHPELKQLEADYEKQLKEGLNKIDFRTAKKTTGTDSMGNQNFWYDIPIVIHIVHDYGAEYLSDDAIFTDLIDWNKVYAHQNPDTINVIQPFIKYEGNPHIRLHLATKDPNGKPTKGITRRRNYNTYFGSDQAKFDDWPPTSYINIWSINVITTGGGVAAAYALFPSAVLYSPQSDGVISAYDYMANWYGTMPYKTINHEMGHCLSLYHPWGGTNNAGIDCGDDAVDDTPPTKGHVIGSVPEGCDPRSLYDTTCAVNYFKLYTTPTATDSLVDYPDTTNAQNIMDYTFCSLMFTKGQVYRMHQALNSPVAGRNNLWNRNNLYFTGVLSDSLNPTSFAPLPDLKPIPEFNVTGGTLLPKSGYTLNPHYFTFPGVAVTFRNETWNDTLTELDWTFSNDAAHPTYNSSANANALTNFNNSFNTPGWVDVKMTATGNHTGDTTVEWPRGVFVADNAGVNATSYYQNFDGADTAKWPSFNYYNNEFKWQWANVGYADNSCIMYSGFDNRINTFMNIYPSTGSPFGDFDDFFSVPMDLSSFTTGGCSLNYFYSGAARTSLSFDMNDELDIDYSINKSQTWTNLAKLTKRGVDNMGSSSVAYYPTSMSDWSQMSINIPTPARTNYTVFRWRYKPGIEVGYDGTTGTGSYSSGNNFFMDRIFISPFPAGVANVKLDNMDVAVAPNPTNGDAYIIIKDAEYAVANIVVTDITGKEVFRTSEQLTSNEARILIPHNAISVPGMYVVQTATGNQIQTRKLMVQ